MSKAGQRRQKRLAQYLTTLIRIDRNKFLNQWEGRMKNWLYEIHRRGDMLRGEAPTDEMVFGVLEQVNRLLDLCSPEVEALVGPSTRETLIHESCRVFSIAVDPRMYSIYNRRQYIKK